MVRGLHQAQMMNLAEAQASPVHRKDVLDACADLRFIAVEAAFAF